MPHVTSEEKIDFILVAFESLKIVLIEWGISLYIRLGYPVVSNGVGITKSDRKQVSMLTRFTGLHLPTPRPSTELSP